MAEDFHSCRRAYYLFLITCSYYLLVGVKDRASGGSVGVKDRASGGVIRGERPWKTPWNHIGLWKQRSREGVNRPSGGGWPFQRLE